MKVRELMTTNVKTCGPRTNGSMLAGIFWSADCGVIPVVDAKNQLLGIVTDRDAFVAVGTRNRRPGDVTVEEIMSRQVVTCNADDDVKQALALMQTRRLRRLPVVNRENVLCGVLSINDLFRTAAPSGELSHASVVAVMKAIVEPPRPEAQPAPADAKPAPAKAGR